MIIPVSDNTTMEALDRRKTSTSWVRVWNVLEKEERRYREKEMWKYQEDTMPSKGSEELEQIKSGTDL